MRAIKLLSLFCLAAMSAFTAQADTVNTGGAPGTYTYTINLGNGASFNMVLDGAFGTPDSNITSYEYIGTPDSSYTSDIHVTTSGNSTYTYASDGTTQVPNDGFDQEVVLQYDSNTTVNEDGSMDYGNTLDYTFAEPTSFWETLGTQSFTTGDGEFLDDLLGWTGQDAIGYETGQFDGEVAEGSNYNYYDNGSEAADPACTECTVTTTFVPAPAATPEPTSLMLFGTGLLAGVAAFRRRFV